MNFLAHLYLSGNDKDLQIGNFIGDSVKGNRWKEYPEGIAKGIQLHRFIDAYTDTHPVNLEVIEFMRPRFGRWSGVALDLTWDHILASSWSNWSSYTVSEFASQCYETLKDNHEVMPDQARFILNHMSANDWLSGYATLEGVGWAFGGLSRRIKYENSLYKGHIFIKENRAVLEEKFVQFFPAIIEACQHRIQDMDGPFLGDAKTPV